MSNATDLTEGANNLLVNCANLNPDESLLIVSEDPDLGWYDRNIVNVLANQARVMGVTPTMIEVGAPGNEKDPHVVKAIEPTFPR